MRRFHSNYGLTSNHLVCWRAWCEAPYLRHYNGVFSTSAVAADTNHADLQTSLVRLGRIELPWVSCSSLPFTKCRVLPHLRSGCGGFIILVESATKPTRGRFGGCGGDLNPAWCRQYATSFIPVRGGCFTPIGLSVPRFPAPHTLAAFSIRPRIHFGRLPRLDCHITDCFHQHHYIVPHPSQRRLTAPTVQFSAGIFVLCVARRSRTHQPGATRQLVEPTRLELVAS